MFLLMAPLTVSSPESLRLREALFFCKKCPMSEWAVRTLPFLVRRTRSLVPLCVFNFGMTAPYYEVKLFSGELWRLVDYDNVAEITDHLFSKFKSEILVGKFAAAVKNGELHFVAVLEKAGDFP